MTKDGITNSKGLAITVVICITLLVATAIGAWVYIEKNKTAQKERELNQQKQLVEFQEEQQNERQSKERQDEALRCFTTSEC